MRIDVLLYQKGMAKSRTAAAVLISEGRVWANGCAVTKPSEQFDEDATLRVERRQTEYVSRGGYKLQAALEKFEISPKGATVLDIGASTGGFTDCLLQHGASFVYALDVGEEQLDESLKANTKVKSMPKTNARSLEKSMFSSEIDIVVMDVSFISQALLYPSVSHMLRESGVFISLLKPQFEAGKGMLGKNGIFKDPTGNILNAITKRLEQTARQNGLTLKAIIPSPIQGGDGNKEYLMHFIRCENEDFNLSQPYKE